MELKEINISCSAYHRDKGSKTCVVYFDISFPAANEGTEELELDNLTFENYYVYSISLYQISGSIETDLLDGKKLMESPHHEIGSQRCYKIFTGQFSAPYRNGCVIRVKLFQPSPLWSNFELRSVKAFGVFKGNTNTKDKILNSTAQQLSKGQSINDLMLSDMTLLLSQSSNQIKGTGKLTKSLVDTHDESYEFQGRRKERKRSKPASTKARRSPSEDSI
jgi:hypothetical protein